MIGNVRRNIRLLYRSPAGRTALAVFLGTLGGAVFTWTGVPLAWFLGAMTTTMLAVFSGLKIEIPGFFRSAMIAVIGVLIGSAFTPAVVAGMADWWQSLVFLIFFITILTILNYFYFRNLCSFDSTTAYFASMPGGIVQMAVIGGSSGADMRRISLAHITRVITVVTVMPLYFRYAENQTINTQSINAGPVFSMRLTDGLILLGGGLVGILLGRILRLPAYALVGPMILSIAIHYLGYSHTAPPGSTIAAAQVIIGASVGCRFSGFAPVEIHRTLLAGLGAGVMMTGAALFAATLMSPLVGVDRFALMLALAPGGVAEMGLIALSLGVSTAYVSSMHIIRIGMIVLIAPTFFNFMRRRETKKPQT